WLRGRPTAPAAGGRAGAPPARAGVAVGAVSADDERLGTAGAPRDRVAAQAATSVDEATVISVAKETELAEPVHITVDGPGEGELAYGHMQIRLAPFAKATFVVDQRGGGSIAENVDFLVDDSAHLDVVLIQDWDDDAVHLAPFAGFSDQGGTVTLNGLYYADDGQHIEHRLLVDHSVPNCKSEILYKGALQGDATSNLPDAHTVWIGDVLIRAAAEGTD